MKIRTSIATILVPSKYLKIGDSLIALTGLIYKKLTGPMTTDELWTAVQRSLKHTTWPQRISFETFWACLLILYAIGAIERQQQDIIVRKEYEINKINRK